MKRVSVSVPDFLLIVNLITGILLYLINYSSLVAVIIHVIITLILVIRAIIISDGPRMTYSTALLMYTCATQFGLVIPYALLGNQAVSGYADWTIRFLHSDYLCKAIILGTIAVSFFELAVQLSRNKYRMNLLQGNVYNENEAWSTRMYIVGILSLLVVLIYFGYHITTGGMSVFASYRAFMQSSAYNSSIYPYVLILFYVGTIYLSAAGEIREHRIGWGLWILLAIVFAFNGNKGEFLYASLAALGMKGVEGYKIKGKIMLLIAGIVFLLIPFITSMRGVGIVGNKWSFSFNFLDAFNEMGMQIRLSVYCLEGLADGSIPMLWGRSYIQPIINIFTPFMKHTIATGELRKMYPGFGFNQVIESYLNFKLIGVLAFFGIVGYFLGKHESIVNNKPKLAYIGTITCILINATRNYFDFVPGQIIIVSAIYFLVLKVNPIKQQQKNGI